MNETTNFPLTSPSPSNRTHRPGRPPSRPFFMGADFSLSLKKMLLNSSTHSQHSNFNVFNTYSRQYTLYSDITRETLSTLYSPSWALSILFFFYERECVYVCRPAGKYKRFRRFQKWPFFFSFFREALMCVF